MPKDKDLKRRVRARMEKTGESYTTARSHILRKQPPPLPDEYATLAGHSDEVIESRTGKTWPAWVRALDEFGAMDLSHTEIARWVNEQTGLGWWSQAVTVGYERIRGLREVGQRRGGGYDANRSKTITSRSACCSTPSPTTPPAAAGSTRTSTSAAPHLASRCASIGRMAPTW